MELGLNGKAALVIGGSAGIGRAVAEQLSREGMRVVLAARDGGRASEAAAAIVSRTGGTVVPLVADVADASEGRAVVEAAARELGGLDVLVNSVPSPVFGAFLDHTDEDWEDAMRTKFFAYVRAIREAVPHLSAGGGVVINVIGTGGKTYLTHHLAGGASNAALMLLSTGLAQELGPLGIRVVGVNPGATRTERLDRIADQLARKDDRSIDEVRQEMAASFPLGSIPEADDVASVVTFLASDLARQVNGTVVTVDGGTSPSV